MTDQSFIEFLLDGKRHKIAFGEHTEMKPSTTVLQYLRSLVHHKGVKEGCAEGDCGACTVVLARPGAEGRLMYEAIDSCLVFLPMIHGGQLITVEDLKHTAKDGVQLHPVQESLVKHNGSQCGYCTPGIAMSMFALYKKHPQPTRDIVLDSLTGNLCRCTGYSPIVKAALEACCHQGKDHFSPGEKEVYDTLMRIRQESVDIALSGGGQQYFLPQSLDAALFLRQIHPDALLVSGATDVALRQTKKAEHLPLILDLSALEELKQFDEDETHITFGAGMHLEAIRQLTRTSLPALHEMLGVFGSLQIRNIATLGGNVGSASPIGDTLPLLFAYGARVNLVNARGHMRTLPMEDFITGYRQTALQPDELIYSISIPRQNPDGIVRSYKVSRRKDLDISTVSAAFALQKNSDALVENIVLAYGGMAAQTQRAVRAEKHLQGKTWSLSTVKEAMKMVEEEFSPLSDARAEAGARKIAASNLLLKFFQETT